MFLHWRLPQQTCNCCYQLFKSIKNKIVKLDRFGKPNGVACVLINRAQFYVSQGMQIRMVKGELKPLACNTAFPFLVDYIQVE